MRKCTLKFNSVTLHTSNTMYQSRDEYCRNTLSLIPLRHYGRTSSNCHMVHFYNNFNEPGSYVRHLQCTFQHCQLFKGVFQRQCKTKTRAQWKSKLIRLSLLVFCPPIKSYLIPNQHRLHNTHACSIFSCSLFFLKLMQAIALNKDQLERFRILFCIIFFNFFLSTLTFSND